MKDTGIVRRIDSLGRVVIPRELITSKGIEPESSVEIYVEGKDNIIVEKAAEESGIVRKIDELGRLVIPREIIKTHGLERGSYTRGVHGSQVRFLLDGKKIIIRKEVAS